MALQKYRTFMVCPIAEGARIETVETPRGFRFATEPDPSGRHFSDQAGLESATLFAEPPEFDTSRLGEPSRHLEVWAEEAATADRVTRAVYCGSLLAIPDHINDRRPVPPLAARGLPRRRLKRPPWRDYFANYNSLAVGCAAAAAAMQDPSLLYALEKHQFSLSLDWFTSKSASPIYGQKFLTHYPNDIAYHVCAAYSLIAAFSIVEELQLEIRSSSKRPRFLDGVPGKWNPEVLSDVEQRLGAIGLSAAEPFHWIVRGDDTELRQELGLSDKPPSWDHQRTDVNDRRLDLIDALHYASWLRNKVSAHRFADLTSQLGPYEVHNCQRLARLLLSAALGLYEIVDAWNRA